MKMMMMMAYHQSFLAFISSLSNQAPFAGENNHKQTNSRKQ
jgi:hypothetical protein